MSTFTLTNEFSSFNVTLAQVEACLNHRDPRGKTWLEYCLERGYDMEDILRPLTYGNYQAPEQGRGRRQRGRHPV